MHPDNILVQPALLALRQAFPDRLATLPPFDACALVDYPLHANPGDHMLFLSALLWLSRQCEPGRMYLAHRLNFSRKMLQQKIGHNPIFCVGGGNLGDLWPNPQRFRENVVRTCTEHPIILLPQWMHFSRRANLERARTVFNAHPQLTIMLRDQVSLKQAREHFTAATLLAPDQALLLMDIVPPRPEVRNGHSFYLSRGLNNREASRELRAVREATGHIPTTNWECMGVRGVLSGLEVYLHPRKAPAATRVDGMPDALRALGNRADCAAYVFRSWRMVQQSIRQLDPYELVITDRFHGHVLCTIRRIPHVVIGDNHHKIQGHWEQWMQGIPGAAFVRSAEELREHIRTRTVPSPEDE